MDTPRSRAQGTGTCSDDMCRQVNDLTATCRRAASPPCGDAAILSNTCGLHFCLTPVAFTSVLHSGFHFSLTPVAFTSVLHLDFTSVLHLWPTPLSYTRQHSDTPSPPHDPLKTHASHMIRDYIWPGSIVLLPCRDLIPYRDDTRHIHVRHRAFFLYAQCRNC